MVILGIISCTQRSEIIHKILDNFIDGSPKELFKVWHHLYERSYTLDTQEAKDRFATFKANLKEIREHNAQDLPYKLGLNQFSDMTKAEFKAKFTTEKEIPDEDFEKLVKELEMTPAFLEDDDDDLTKRNLAKNPINHSKFYNAARSQEQCGSCWAFSTAGAVEGGLGKKAGKPINYLSTQQLVDCDKQNDGCDGGALVYAFDYMKKNGVMFDKDYAYKGSQGSCKYSSSKATNKIKGVEYCKTKSSSKNPCSIEKVYNLLVRGPLSVVIDADAIEKYKSGIFTGKCSKSNHAVILVGYAVDPKSGEYWIVRNSWGADWGEKGYIRVKVSESNKSSCFLTYEAFLPLL